MYTYRNEIGISLITSSAAIAAFSIGAASISQMTRQSLIHHQNVTAEAKIAEINTEVSQYMKDFGNCSSVSGYLPTSIQKAEFLRKLK